MEAIRHAGAGDVAAVLAFWNVATTAASPTDDAAALRALLARHEDAVLLAIDDDQIVGTVICTFDGWRGAMYRLTVDPAMRRRHVATSLVDAAERQLCASGARRCHVIVRRTRSPRARSGRPRDTRITVTSADTSRISPP
jgi:ribosomal protein S18 acetylase RimI-like enzyme